LLKVNKLKLINYEKMEKAKKVKVIPIEVDVLKSGKSTKDGKTFDWTLYKVSARVLPKEQKIEMMGFDGLEAGTETEVELWQEDSEEYGKRWKYRTPRRNVWQEIDDLKKRVEKLEREESVESVEEEPDEDININDF
jgi:hypothetical protein